MMEEIIEKTVRDQAFSHFLKYYYKDLESYKYYCDLYIRGDFESFPFAYDHYHTEYYTDTIWIDDSHYEKYYDSYKQEYYDVWVQGGHYETYTRSYEVFDYREYFEVHGSMDINKAKHYSELYNEKEALLSQYNALCIEKSTLESTLNSKNSSISWKKFLIILISCFAVYFTIFTCHQIYKHIDQIKDSYKKLFSIEKINLVQNDQLINT
jgi:hypothetical protein